MAVDPMVMRCMEIWGGNEPVDTRVAPAGLDVWIYSRPHGNSQQGGDVYYVSSCATGRITRILIADVSGHGDAVGATARELRGMMRRNVNFLDQRRFVQSMNAQFSALSTDGRFATAVVTTFFAPTLQLSMCNAGHPPPLIFHARERVWDFARSAPANSEGELPPSMNLPLGVIDLTDYEQFSLRLDVGDLVLCYTDSLIESLDANGAMLGAAGLLKLVRALADAGPAQLVPSLLASISGLNPGNLTRDDVTALLFRPNGAARAAALVEQMKAPFRLLAGVADYFRGHGLPWPDLSLANLGGALIKPLNRAWRPRTAKIPPTLSKKKPSSAD